MHYDAFISYSHAADGKLAPALQSALQRFAKPWYRRRALRVFRDQTSLAATPELWPSIQQALDSADHFLLLASPEAAHSRWVRREVAHWLATKPIAHLLIVLTGGTLVWDEANNDFDWSQTNAIPEELKGAFRSEPLWVDLRWARDEEQLTLKHPRFLEAVGDLAAPLRGQPKEDLLGEDVRQHQRSMRLAGAAIAALVALMIVAAVAAVVAAGQRDEAVVQRGLAAIQQREAEHQASIAQTQEAEAERNANLAAAAQQTAEARRAEADEARVAAEEQARVALARQLAAQAVSTPDGLDLALLLSLEANRLNPGAVDARGSLLTTLEMNPHLRTFLRGHQDWVQSLAFSPDGKLLASGGRDHLIWFWDPATGQPAGVPLAGHERGILGLAFSPDGATLASAGEDGALRLWDVASRSALGPPLVPAQGEGDYNHALRGVAFSPDGTLLAASGVDGVWVWDLSAERPVPTALSGHTASVPVLAFSPDGTLLASGDENGTIRLWDAKSLQPAGAPLAMTWGIYSLAFSANSTLLASGSADGTSQIWEVPAGDAHGQPLAGHQGPVMALGFNQDGTVLVTGGSDGILQFWDSLTGTLIHDPWPAQGRVEAIAFSPDGETMATGGSKQTVVLWDIGALDTLTGHTDRIFSLDFNADGTVLASGSEDGTVRLWDVATRSPLGPPLKGHQGRVQSVDFSPDGALLASAGADGTIRFWNPDDGAAVDEPLQASDVAINRLAFSPDGLLLAAAADDGTVQIWDVASHRAHLPPFLDGEGLPVYAVTFSPNGTMLAWAGQFPLIEFVDPATGAATGESLVGHEGSIEGIAFRPDGKLLASTGDDGTIRLWNVDSRTPDGAPIDVDRLVWNVDFSPDGALLAAAVVDGTVRLWDVATRLPLGAPLTGIEGTALTIRFSPDGTLLATAGENGTIVLHDVNFASWQRRACTIANRNLTHAEWSQYFGNEPYHKTCSDLPEPGRQSIEPIVSEVSDLTATPLPGIG